MVKDLIPPPLSSSGRTVDRPDDSASSLLYPDESHGENRRIGTGEYFSLSHCIAALPDDLLVDNDGGAAVPRRTVGEGVSAMLAGRMARSSGDDVQSRDATNTHYGADKDDGSNDEDALQLLYISSRNTFQIHCIDITSRCTPSNPKKQQRGTNDTTTATNANAAVANRDAFRENDTGNNTANDNDYNAEELDGWRGYYNPFHDGLVNANATVNTNTNNNSNNNKSISSKQTNKRSAAEQRILDEHLSTNAAADHNSTENSNSLQQSSLFASSPFAREVKHARIVGVACCSSSNNNVNNNCKDHYVASITDQRDTTGIIVHVNPHLRLETSLPPQTAMMRGANNNGGGNTPSKYSMYYRPSSEFKFKHHGDPRCVSVQPGVVCVGTDTGVVLIYVFDCRHRHDHGNNCNNNNNSNSGTVGVGSHGKMALVAEIPAPRGGDNSQGNDSLYCVSSVELIPPPSSEFGMMDSTNHQKQQQQQASHNNNSIHRLFVSYRRRSIDPTPTDAKTNNPKERNATTTSSSTPTGGVCCYELGGLRIPGAILNDNHNNLQSVSVVSARYDMDGRDVPSSNLCSVPSPPSLVFNNRDVKSTMPRYTVARGDGLHFYSRSEKAGVCPVDGDKVAMCHLPPVSPVAYLKRRRPPRVLHDEEQKVEDENVTSLSGGGRNDSTAAGASYVLVATTDAKAHRDAVDVYDTSNKLVGFHVLLSPGHRALRSLGLMASPVVRNGVLVRGGRTSGVVFTSGGSIVTLTGELD